MVVWKNIQLFNQRFDLKFVHQIMWKRVPIFFLFIELMSYNYGVDNNIIINYLKLILSWSRFW